MKAWIAISLGLVLLIGSLFAFSEEDAEEAGEEKVAVRVCVNKRNINSFDAIDDQHVYIKASGNKHYLFTMQRKCFGLRSAFGIAVKDTMSSVCSKGLGEIVYRDMGQRLESCRIDTIEVVAGKDDAKQLVEDRRAEKQPEQSEN